MGTDNNMTRSHPTAAAARKGAHHHHYPPPPRLPPTSTCPLPPELHLLPRSPGSPYRKLRASFPPRTRPRWRRKTPPWTEANRTLPTRPRPPRRSRTTGAGGGRRMRTLMAAAPGPAAARRRLRRGGRAGRKRDCCPASPVRYRAGFLLRKSRQARAGGFTQVCNGCYTVTASTD